MSKLLNGKHACINPKCLSSDAMRMYEDETGFCFSCSEFFSKEQLAKAAGNNDAEIEEEFEKMDTPTKRLKVPDAPKSKYTKITVEDVSRFPIRGFKDRGIMKNIAEFFNVRVTYDEDGSIEAHYYPYASGTAWKIRKLPKDFTWINKSADLFGKEKFTGGGRRLVICEGEIDCMTMAQASFEKYGKVYPVVSLSSSVMTKSILENRDWVRSFQEVILMFDHDDAGDKATAEAIKIIGADKVKIAKLPCNDVNETYVQHGGPALMNCMFDAAAYIPPGIIGKEAIWEALVNYNSAVATPYPPCLEGVNTKLKGMREGEITLFISGTGSGKSTLLRETIMHLLETEPNSKVGIVSLEESPQETARKLAGMAINRNPAYEEIPIEDLKVGFDAVFGSDRVVLLDHQGSINDSRIIDQLEYMCLVGCTHLFVDHITILVSEGVENLTGNEAQDKVMNDLLRIVKRYPVWIGLVSHLRKAPGGGKAFEEGKLPSIDDIRGSGSVKQISFDIIAFARNLTATDENERNTILMRVLKSRYTGLTGTVNGARYIYETGRLVSAITGGDDDDFVAL